MLTTWVNLIRERRNSIFFFNKYLPTYEGTNYARILWTATGFKYFYKIQQTNIFQKTRITLLKFFTKKTNQCKLYVYGKSNIFLSSGIILRFLKLSKRKALKKHKRIWVGTIRALKALLVRPAVLYFDNLFGMRFSLFEKLLKRKLLKAWIFIKLFYLNFALPTKKHRRIKRWLRKRHYRLGIAENK